MSISLTCECGRRFETLEANVGQHAHCPWCGRALIVPKPSVLVEDDWLPFKPELTTTSGKAIASLVFGALFILACVTSVPAILLGRAALRDIRQSGGRLTGKRMAVAGILLGALGCVFTAVLVMAAFGVNIEASRRYQCTNNLKQIGFAIYEYYDKHGYFPPAAITDKNGKPLLSWRIAILPYLEERLLFDKFRLGEPWDSPHNIALVEATARAFDCPSDRTQKPGTTGYLAVIGADTAFSPDFRPLLVQDFPDGTSNTLLIGESKHSVVWTRPEDLPFDMSIPFSGLGSFHGRHNDGFNVITCDGSVYFFKSAISPKRVRSILNRSDDAVVGPDSY